MSDLSPREVEQLSAFIDDELDDAERAEVEALLERDPEARRAVEELRLLAAMVSDEPVPPPPSSLARRIADRSRSRRAPRSARGRWMVPLAAAATLVLAVLIGVIGLRQPLGPATESAARSSGRGTEPATGAPPPVPGAIKEEVFAPEPANPALEERLAPKSTTPAREESSSSTPAGPVEMEESAPPTSLGAKGLSSVPQTPLAAEGDAAAMAAPAVGAMRERPSTGAPAVSGKRKSSAEVAAIATGEAHGGDTALPPSPADRAPAARQADEKRRPTGPHGAPFEQQRLSNSPARAQRADDDRPTDSLASRKRELSDAGGDLPASAGAPNAAPAPLPSWPVGTWNADEDTAAARRLLERNVLRLGGELAALPAGSDGFLVKIDAGRLGELQRALELHGSLSWSPAPPDLPPGQARVEIRIASPTEEPPARPR